MNEEEIAFGKTHDLAELLDLIVLSEPSWAVWQPQAIHMTEFAVRYRYPGISATKAEAKEAIKNCRALRKLMRTAMGLSA